MDDIETITDEGQQPEGEEPWCVKCREYTDYRRKWSTVPRSDMDGGIYSEVNETPHCIECSQPMHYLSNCRLLVWSVNSLMALGWSIALMVAYVLFEFSLVGISMLALFSLLCFALSRIPRKSRAILREWKRWKEEQGLKELIDQSPGK